MKLQIVWIKCIILGKKKAPAPPPRTTTAVPMKSNGPVATPRNVLQKLAEEQAKDENSNAVAETKVADQLKGKIWFGFCQFYDQMKFTQ